MKLQYPVQISSRLLPSVTIGDVTISIERDDYATAYNSPDGRDVFKFYLDGKFIEPIEYESNDLKSGCQGSTLREALISLLDFLSAGSDCDDSYPNEVNSWRHYYSDELSLVRCELEEQPELFVED